MTYQTPQWAEWRESEIICIPIFPELMISWESGDEDRWSEACAAALDCADWGRQDWAVSSCSQVMGRRVPWGRHPWEDGLFSIQSSVPRKVLREIPEKHSCFGDPLESGVSKDPHLAPMVFSSARPWGQVGQGSKTSMARMGVGLGGDKFY